MDYRVTETMVHTADFDAAIAFYRDVLGWKQTTNTDWGWATFEIPGGAVLGVLAWSEPDALPAPKVGLQTDDIEAFVAEMTAKGIRTDAIKGQPGSTRCVNFFDPDGNAFFVWDDGSGKIG